MGKKLVRKDDLKIGICTDGECSVWQTRLYRHAGCSGFFFLPLRTASLWDWKAKAAKQYRLHPAQPVVQRQSIPLQHQTRGLLCLISNGCFQDITTQQSFNGIFFFFCVVRRYQGTW